MGNCHRHHERDQAGLRCPTQSASRPNTVEGIMIAKQNTQPAIDVADLAPCADTLHALLVARSDALIGCTEGSRNLPRVRTRSRHRRPSGGHRVRSRVGRGRAFAQASLEDAALRVETYSGVLPLPILLSALEEGERLNSAAFTCELVRPDYHIVSRQGAGGHAQCRPLNTAAMPARQPPKTGSLPRP